MKHTFGIGMLVLIGTAGVVFPTFAQDATNSGMQKSSTPDEVELSPYRANEFSVDGFASGSIGQRYIDHLSGRTLRHDARFGAGVGANFFFTRYLGIGGDAYSENVKGPFIDSASGNLIGRLPIGNTGFAPYIFGGAGHQFDQIQQTFGQAGAGLEFRKTHHVGFFVDARWVFPDKSDNYGLARGGLRLSF